MADISKVNGANVKAEIERVLEQVEETLSDVLTGIRKLDEESQQAKTEITQAIGRQLTHLHNRQTQLLRQVDVISQARGEVLHDQLAYCYRLLGSLQTNKWSEKLQYHKTGSGISGLKKTSSLNWSLNEGALSSAIDGFGHVDMDGILLGGIGSGEQSKCLPAKFEEYEDDQHVMEKPLHSSNVINMKFPKLPKDYTYWLSHNKNEKKADIADSFGYGPYRKALDSFKPCDVQTWLGCIQTETAAEPMEDQNSIPEMISLSETSSIVSSKQSDLGSIEVVASSCFHSTEGLCKQQGISDVEIENLAENFSHCLADKQRWLAPKRKQFDDIPTDKTCRANETCMSYDQCICQDNCHDVALKNRDQKQQQVAKKNDTSSWLRQSWSRSSPAPSHVPILPSSLKQNGDANQWLKRPSHKSKDTANQELKNQQPIRHLDVKGPWLKCGNNLNHPPTQRGVPTPAANTSPAKVQNIQHAVLTQWLRT